MGAYVMMINTLLYYVRCFHNTISLYQEVLYTSPISNVLRRLYRLLISCTVHRESCTINSPLSYLFTKVVLCTAPLYCICIEKACLMNDPQLILYYKGRLTLRFSPLCVEKIIYVFPNFCTF